MICFLYKRWISHKLDSDGRITGAAARHLARCPSCRRFYRACLALNGRLRADACMEGWLRETPIRQRAMSVIRRRAPRTVFRTSRAAALAACLAFALAGALLFLEPAPSHDTTPEGYASLKLLDRVLPDTDGEALNMEVTEPLTAEMERLSADLDSTMKFMGSLLSAALRPRDVLDGR